MNLQPFPESIAVPLGAIAGTDLFLIVGERRDVSQTVVEMVWDGPTADYPWDTNPGTATILSTSLDDAAAGAGAQTVRVTGLDENYVEKAVTVTMNGLTPTALPGDWSRISIATVLTVGTVGGANAGEISIMLDGAVVSFMRGPIAPGIKAAGRSYLSGITVPAGKSFVFTGSMTFVEATKTISIELRFRRRLSVDDTVARAWSTSATLFGLTGFNNIPLVPSVIFPEFTDVELTAIAETPNAAVTNVMSGYFVDAAEIGVNQAPDARII